MIINFFLDNRVGGPHNYSKQINKYSIRKFINVTSGVSKLNSKSITNLRKYSKYFFFIEIIINFFEILFFFHKKKYKYFYIFSILNFAPIIVGIFLRKKMKWFIVEEPNFYTKFFFKILNFVGNFEIIVIANFIGKNLSIKNFAVVKPQIDTDFWKKKTFHSKKVRTLKITCIGNINKIKNHLNLIKFLKEINFDFELNIIGEVLSTQKNYFEKIKHFQNEINKKKFKRINIIGRQNKYKIRSILNKTDIYMLPSLTEGLSISLMEAMSMGCICLISKNSNKSNIIKNGKNGFTFNLSKNSFKNSIVKIFNLKNKDKKLIHKLARETILKQNLINKKFND